MLYENIFVLGKFGDQFKQQYNYNWINLGKLVPPHTKPNYIEFNFFFTFCDMDV